MVLDQREVNPSLFSLIQEMRRAAITMKAAEVMGLSLFYTYSMA